MDIKCPYCRQSFDYPPKFVEVPPSTLPNPQVLKVLFQATGANNSEEGGV